MNLSCLCVNLQISDIKWASRWDTYLLMTDDQIHWFSIINSLMIVLFLSGMVAMIMMRTLHRDISKYNQLESQDEAQVRLSPRGCEGISDSVVREAGSIALGSGPLWAWITVALSLMC